MQLAAFICDDAWRIDRVLENTLPVALPKDALLSDIAEGIAHLENPSDKVHKESFKHDLVNLRFKGVDEEVPALVFSYPNRFMVFASVIDSMQDLRGLAQSLVKHLTWADENIPSACGEGRFQIELLNDRLLDSERAIMKKNHRLEHLLKEVRRARDTVTALERDNVTSLYDSSGFHHHVQERLDANPETAFDMIAVDVKGFRLINEVYGRDAGDRALRDIAGVLSGLKGADEALFARVYSSTFYVFAPSELRFYEAIDRKLGAFLADYPLPIQLHLQIGVYFVDDEGLYADEMCNRARLALTRLPDRNCAGVVFFDSKLRSDLVTRHQIIDRVPIAVHNGEFKLFLQPKVDMIAGCVIGAEALVRWNHAELGFLAPDKFIPLLEENGSIYAVDRYIWEKTCEFLQKRKEMGLVCLPISVNIARSDLYEENLVEVLTSLVRDHGLTPDLLHLEILERAYVKDTGRIKDVLQSLRDRGFFIEMDDFGTGESSLSMLADLPVDLIKLDRNFLKSGLSDKRRVEVVRFVIQLARSLDMKVIAEGVETKDQEEVLTSMDCHYAQGYYYCRPQPAEVFLTEA